MMTESGRDAIERGVVHATGSDAIDIETDRGHATDAEITTETKDGGIAQEAGTISDVKTAQNVGENAMWMTGGQGRGPKTADAIERFGAGRHTKETSDEEISFVYCIGKLHYCCLPSVSSFGTTLRPMSKIVLCCGSECE